MRLYLYDAYLRIMRSDMFNFITNNFEKIEKFRIEIINISHF